VRISEQDPYFVQSLTNWNGFLNSTEIALSDRYQLGSPYQLDYQFKLMLLCFHLYWNQLFDPTSVDLETRY